jgi:hypothetical protein
MNVAVAQVRFVDLRVFVSTKTIALGAIALTIEKASGANGAPELQSMSL